MREAARALALAADREARELAQREFVRPLVLEAGAGTGKTTTLVARVLAWVLGPGWQRVETRLAGQAGGASDELVAGAVLSGVVAITFTEAAAAEMASRLATELGAISRGGRPDWLSAPDLPAPETLARRAKALVGTLDHLVVRTIHAFCRSLLAAHPLEARLHPQLEVDAAGTKVEEICRERVEDALARAYGEPGDEDFFTLAVAGIGPEALSGALAQLVLAGVPHQALAEDPFAPGAIAALVARLEAALRPLAAATAPLAVMGSRNQRTLEVVAAIQASLARLAQAVPVGEEELAQLAAAFAALWPEPCLERLGDWSKGRVNQGEQAALAGETEALGAAAGPALRLLRHLVRLDPRLLAAGRRALAPLFAEVLEELRVRGVVTFAALQLEARELLRRHAGVRRRVRAGIDQLLVVEFQDTDPLQCDVVRVLALEGPAEQRPGLFLVGDPKQSIYGWRSADLAAYDEFVREVVEAGGEVRPLAVNFRSVPAILAEVERVVEPLLVAERGVQPAFQGLVASPKLEASPGFEVGAWRPVEHWVSWAADAAPGETRAGEATRLEAEALARDVRRLNEAGTAWNEIGVLLRSTGDLDVYLEALRRSGVPFAVGRDTQYYQRREVIDAAALVRAILDPGDGLALLTLLRSPLVGVPDAALLPLWRRGLPRLVAAGDLEGVAATATAAARELPADVQGLAALAAWPRSLIAAAGHLVGLRRTFETGSAVELVASLRRLFRQEVLESARYLGRYRLANLERFHRQLLEALEDGADVPGLLRFLRRSVAEAEEAEEARPLEGGADAVQVSTIHAAKGLGFEHVYLLQTHKKEPARRSPTTAFAKAGATTELVLFGAPSLGWDLVEAAVRRRENAERVRLLYVALTRAKQRLVIAGAWPARPGAGAGDPSSLLQLLAERRPGPPDPAALLERSGESAGAAVDDGAARWVFLGRALAAGEAAAPANTPREELPALAEVERESEELAARRKRARSRQGRPLSQAASALAHAELAELLAAEGREQELASGEGAGASDAGAPAARAAAQAIGVAVHRALETFDLGAEPRAEITRQQALLEKTLAPLASRLPPGLEVKELARQAGLFVAGLAGGRLLTRLRELREHVLARELPLLGPPPDGDVGPLLFTTGCVDLLYRDPVDGEIVIVDFKTDEIESTDGEANEAALAARTAAYAPQGESYRRALRQAFALASPPRFELWFLAVDRIVVVPPAG